MSSSKDFRPTHFLKVDTSCYLLIQIFNENGESFVYSAFYSSKGVRSSGLFKSVIRCGRYGRLYFNRNNQKFFLREFSDITRFDGVD